MMEQILSQAGARCEIAGNLAEARRCLNPGLPDLVLCDLRLPDGTGNDLCRELRADDRTRDLRVLITTATEDPGQSIHLREGVDMAALLLDALEDMHHLSGKLAEKERALRARFTGVTDLCPPRSSSWVPMGTSPWRTGRLGRC